MNNKYPYSDDHMIFDPNTNRYYLTEQALLDCGIDLRARLAARKAISPDNVIHSILRIATRHVYAFIHRYNIDNAAQDKAVACVPSLRPIIEEALLVQAVYTLNVGDLSNSVKPEERAAAYHPELEDILGVPVCELGGRSILYAGVR